MEDRRAHDRIDALETAITKIADAQIKNDKALLENTELTRQLVANTQTIVDLVKGAKYMRGAIMWLTPIVAAIYITWEAFVAWIRAHIH